MCHVATDWRRFWEIRATPPKPKQRTSQNRSQSSFIFLAHRCCCCCLAAPFTLNSMTCDTLPYGKRYPDKCTSAHSHKWSSFFSLRWSLDALHRRSRSRSRMRTTTYRMCFMDVHPRPHSHTLASVCSFFDCHFYPGWLLWSVRGTSNLHSISIALRRKRVHVPFAGRPSYVFRAQFVHDRIESSESTVLSSERFALGKSDLLSIVLS